MGWETASPAGGGGNTLPAPTSGGSPTGGGGGFWDSVNGFLNGAANTLGNVLNAFNGFGNTVDPQPQAPQPVPVTTVTQTPAKLPIGPLMGIGAVALVALLMVMKK
ncbi:hypothetical protein [Polycladidibacter hongkongensis]|uniref:hypothetical protein n=1 Tax=Polycladidibacter hongkongensis TaxID=1647556 RepID=UPI000835DB37|nr:hypothetical protein [Pseudovibrio hongkongensis]